jgi:hypothetical protein
MMTKRFYRFAYPLGDGGARALSLHTLRDGDAFIEIAAVLSERGGVYGDTLFNLPGTSRMDGSKALLKTAASSDLLVLTTRPPLRDDQDEARKALPLGNTMTERSILGALRPCFKFCDRAHISLAKCLARQLPDGYEDRATIFFTQYLMRSPAGADAAYKFLQAEGEGRPHRPPMPHRTAVFLIRTALWPGGPWVLNAFGMSGNQGLIWAHLLRTRYAHLLVGEGPLFFMGEVILEDIPPRPFTLAFAESWRVTQLLCTQDVPQVPATKRCPARTCAATHGREAARAGAGAGAGSGARADAATGAM